MKRPSKAPEPRKWPASIIRGRRLEFLGFVHKGADQDAAEAAAVKEFGLNDEQRKRLVLQEQA
jgi:hypothetical protein